MLKRMYFAPEVCCGPELSERLRYFEPGARILVLITDSAGRTGLLDQVAARLSDASAYELIQWTWGEPAASSVAGLRQRVQEFKPDWIVGIGGGTVLDAAKFVSAEYENPALHWSEQTQAVPGPRTRARLALVPTTSGSGSEASQAAILTGSDGKKLACVSPYWLPDLVILDPVLTTTLPAAETASTGFDALAHAVESTASNLAHDLLRELCATAIRAILRHLARAVDNPREMEARAGLQNAAFLAGSCQSGTSTGAAHALAHATSQHYHTPHARAVSAYLLPTMRWNLAKNPRVYDAMAAACGMSDGMALIGAIEELARAVGSPLRLADLLSRELTASERRDLAGAALKDGCLRTNACRMRQDDLEAVLCGME
jgi:alcohol dehydrogenase class IV